MPRLLRITTVPISLKLLLRGQLSFFKENGFEVLAVSSDGPEVQSLTDEGIPHAVVQMTRVISPLRDLVALFTLVRVIRKFRPDIVHTHTPKAGLLGMLAAWLCRVPVRLHTVAGLPVMERRGFVRQLLLLTERITYACATTVYPNSRGLKTFIDKHIATQTPVKIIGNGSSNGIDTRFFTPTDDLRAEGQNLRHQYAIPDNALVFSFIGRIVADKGVNELVRAFHDLSARMNVYLLLTGPFEDELDPVSAESRRIIGESKRIITPGYVNDVRPVLIAADVFVLPSYREGFPNVVMQACCMGTPCIVSDINGCNEIIAHNETGLIVRPKDPDALRSAMETMASYPDLRDAFSTRARDHVVRNYDQGFVWNELLGEYRRHLRNQ